MKKHVLLAKTLMMLALTGALSWGSLTSVYAQVSAYSFAESTETYAQITGTTSTATGDDGSQNAIAIGFTFNFGGLDFTTFSVNANGFIRLGANIAGAPWTNSVANVSTQSPLIAAFWDDNNMTGGQLRYATTGSAPNRVLTVNWHNSRIGGGGSTGGATNSYLIRLYETSNMIEYVYGSSFTTTNTVTAFVGIGNGASYLSVTPAAVSTASNATQNHGITAAVMANLAGKKLTFSPPSCVAPGGLNASLVSTTEGNFSWNAAVPAPGVGYEWAVTTSATPPASGTATAGLTGNNNTLSANTAYWLHVRSECSAGVYSGWSTTSFNTTAGYTCALPIAITSLPYNAAHTTCGAGNNYANQCSGNYGGGEDLVFEIQITTTGNHQIEITGTTTYIGWFLKDNANCAVPSSCLANAVSSFGTTATGIYDFTSTGTYYLIVDTWPAPACGSFNLAINPPVPAPGCASNFVVTPTVGCDNYPVTVSWDAAATATGYRITVGTTSGGNDIANNVNLGNVLNYTINAPTLSTQYFYTVTPFNVGGDAVGCTEQDFTTGSAGCACIPVYTVGKTDGDLISQVAITGTTLNNNSGTSPTNPAFTYFNTLPEHTGDLQAGTTYNIQVTYGSFTAQQCAVWIDFNENGVFETTERVGFTTSNSTAAFQTVSFPISLPCNPTPGVKRMRVRNVYFTNGNTIDPCATYSFGETEDYDVTILPPPACPSITGLAAGTPTAFSVPLNWTIGCAESAWNVEYGPVGFTPGTGTTVSAGTNVNFD
jgi:hypothetical protein